MEQFCNNILSRGERSAAVHFEQIKAAMFVSFCILVPITVFGLIVYVGFMIWFNNQFLKL